MSEEETKSKKLSVTGVQKSLKDALKGKPRQTKGQIRALRADDALNPMVQMSLGQRFSGAAQTFVEQNTLGKMGWVGRAAMAKRRGWTDNVLNIGPFRAELRRIARRAVLGKLGIFGDIVGTHFDSKILLEDELEDTAIQNKPRSEAISTTAVYDILQDLSEKVDKNFRVVAQQSVFISRAFQQADKNFQAFQSNISESITESAEKAAKFAADSLNSKLSKFQEDIESDALVTKSKLSTHDRQIDSIYASIDFLKKEIRGQSKFETRSPINVLSDEKEAKGGGLISSLGDLLKNMGMGGAVAGGAGAAGTAVILKKMLPKLMSVGKFALGRAVPAIGLAILGYQLYQYLTDGDEAKADDKISDDKIKSEKDYNIEKRMIYIYSSNNIDLQADKDITLTAVREIRLKANKIILDAKYIEAEKIPVSEEQANREVSKTFQDSIDPDKKSYWQKFKNMMGIPDREGMANEMIQQGNRFRPSGSPSSSGGYDLSQESIAENATSKSLTELRSKFDAEVENNPEVKKKLFALMKAEVGSMGPDARKAWLETVYNRAYERNVSVDKIISDRAYYEPLQTGKYQQAYNSLSEEDIKLFEGAKKEVIAGSNITQGGMHNASAGVAAKVKRGGYDSVSDTVKDFNGETFYGKKWETAARKKINQLYESDKNVIQRESTNVVDSRDDFKQPITSGIPKDIIATAEKVAIEGGPQAVSSFMAKQGYPKNGAWCGQFAAAMVKAAGGTPPKNPAVASNWRNYGTKVDGAPMPGDIAVKKNSRFGGGYVRTGSTGSHVTLVKDFNPDNPNQFTSLGGNQGKFVKNYKTGQYEFFRANSPSIETQPVIPQPNMPSVDVTRTPKIQSMVGTPAGPAPEKNPMVAATKNYEISQQAIQPKMKEQTDTIERSAQTANPSGGISGGERTKQREDQTTGERGGITGGKEKSASEEQTDSSKNIQTPRHSPAPESMPASPGDNGYGDYKNCMI